MLVACARSDDAVGHSGRPGETAEATPAQATPRATPPPASWTVTETGWGPVRAGMTVAEARAALGGDFPEPTDRECDHVKPPHAPPGVLIMTVAGQVARVEVSDTTVATAAGARVGDAEARIETLYPGRVRTRPHKYVDGHYLIVPQGAGADSVHRLVFETDGRRVTSYRGRTVAGDRARNENFYAQSADAIAVADGIVVATKDSIPENVPGPTSRAVPITLETVGGNFVILDIGGGRYAFYAHLRPGSLRVRTGDRARRGQVLGLVGNSGNSTEPHLHFHLADGSTPLGAEGIPYAHDSFEVLGRCRSLLGGCSRSDPDRRQREMPVANMIIRFPD
jgi:hypothetical protein